VQAHDLARSVEGLAEVDFKRIAAFNAGEVGVFWSSTGVSPWERHPTDEELLFVIEGAVTIEVLTENRSVEVPVSAGSVFVVPRNHWHRHKHTGLVKEMYLTPGPTDISFDEDPREQTN
jgi:quercetin dioxygenase-like cupin family protein